MTQRSHRLRVHAQLVQIKVRQTRDVFADAIDGRFVPEDAATMTRRDDLVHGVFVVAAPHQQRMVRNLAEVGEERLHLGVARLRVRPRVLSGAFLARGVHGARVRVRLLRRHADDELFVSLGDELRRHLLLESPEDERGEDGLHPRRARRRVRLARRLGKTLLAVVRERALPE